jgi:hypothetical protein
MSLISLKRWRGGMPRLATGLLVSVIATGGVLAATTVPGTTAQPFLQPRSSAIASTSSSESWSPYDIAVLPHTNTVWMTGDIYTARGAIDGTLWSSNGGSWLAVKGLPASPHGEFSDIRALSAKEVWIEESLLSGNTAFLVFNGSSWHSVPVNLPPSLGLSPFFISSLVLSANDIWATTYRANCNGVCPIVLVHYDGTTWSKPAVPLLGGATVVALAGSSPDDLWLLAGTCSPATGTCSSPFALRFDGAWAKFAVPGELYYGAGLAVSSLSDAWVQDISDVAHFNGSHFIVQRGWSKSDEGFLGIAPFGLTSAWVIAHPLMRFNGVSGTPVSFSLPGHSPAFSLVAASSPESAWLVGSGWTGAVCHSQALYFAFHFNGTKWLRIGLPLQAWPISATRTVVNPEC